jgi:hypothetical protein
VLVLGGHCARLGCAHKIRDYVGTVIEISLIDRKPYLSEIPSPPEDIFADRNPVLTTRMDIVAPLEKDDIRCAKPELKAINP